jgi:hypothetical protein
MTITRIEFQSSHFSIAGMGGIEALTFYPDYAYFGSRLLIAGEPIVASGQGMTDRAHFPPSFTDLELCGGGTDHAVSCEAIRAGVEGGYVLTLSAVPRQ